MIDDHQIRLISEELNLQVKQIRRVLRMLDEGYTVPFLSRYRKERTSNLSEGVIRRILEGLEDAEEFNNYRKELLERISERLPEEIRQRAERSRQRSNLDDLVGPYLDNDEDTADTERDVQLNSLAMMIRMQRNPVRDIDSLASKLVNPEHGLADVEAVIDGALGIISRQLGKDADHRKNLRDRFRREGKVICKVVPGKEANGKKFKQYFDHSEPISEIPSYRLLALRRAEAEGVVHVSFEISRSKMLKDLKSKVIHTSTPEVVKLLEKAVTYCLDEILLPPARDAIRNELFRQSEGDAIAVFARNLRRMLLASPAPGLRLLGLDSGLRWGCKLAAIDDKGGFLEAATIYLGNSPKKKEKAIQRILDLVTRHSIDVICMGGGPGAREADELVREALSKITDRRVLRVTVNRTGSNVYAASEAARDEFPNLDVATRSAVSIARHFRDPLDELVKVEPMSVGVGQYLQEVNPDKLKTRLESVVESTVNQIGVDLNTASASLLSHISGLAPAIAEEIVRYREKNGRFNDRLQLRFVPGINPKVFKLAAGFLRVHEGDQPLDRTAIHPEYYSVVEMIAAEHEVSVPDLMGNQEVLRKIRWGNYKSKSIGMPSLKQIHWELGHPGEESRKPFDITSYVELPTFSEFESGMVLGGVITNVTNFGAFVDLGGNQDGFVHVSEISRKFVNDPSSVVQVGDRVTVKVMQIDKDRNRINLSIKRARGKELTHPPPPKSPAAETAPVETAESAEASETPTAEAPAEVSTESTPAAEQQSQNTEPAPQEETLASETVEPPQPITKEGEPGSEPDASVTADDSQETTCEADSPEAESPEESVKKEGDLSGKIEKTEQDDNFAQPVASAESNTSVEGERDEDN